MSRVRITMDNAALRDVATGALAGETGFDVRAVQVIRRIGASHGGRPVDEVYEALRAGLARIPGPRRWEETRVHRCAVRISERRDPLART
ncbi:hypothetical protein GCM10017673_13190 [Streptosporangium violaceochromogenes]|nr:hypothetical protein GCM10017673_13190 [Streptosporangium violaceochromogenes]